MWKTRKKLIIIKKFICACSLSTFIHEKKKRFFCFFVFSLNLSLDIKCTNFSTIHNLCCGKRFHFSPSKNTIEMRYKSIIADYQCVRENFCVLFFFPRLPLCMYSVWTRAFHFSFPNTSTLIFTTILYYIYCDCSIFFRFFSVLCFRIHILMIFDGKINASKMQSKQFFPYILCIIYVWGFIVIVLFVIDLHMKCTNINHLYWGMLNLFI